MHGLHREGRQYLLQLPDHSFRLVYPPVPPDRLSQIVIQKYDFDNGCPMAVSRGRRRAVPLFLTRANDSRTPFFWPANLLLCLSSTVAANDHIELYHHRHRCSRQSGLSCVVDILPSSPRTIHLNRGLRMYRRNVKKLYQFPLRNPRRPHSYHILGNG